MRSIRIIEDDREGANHVLQNLREADRIPEGYLYQGFTTADILEPPFSVGYLQAEPVALFGCDLHSEFPCGCVGRPWFICTERCFPESIKEGIALVRQIRKSVDGYKACHSKLHNIVWAGDPPAIALVKSLGFWIDNKPLTINGGWFWEFSYVSPSGTCGCSRRPSYRGGICCGLCSEGCGRDRGSGSGVLG